MNHGQGQAALGDGGRLEQLVGIRFLPGMRDVQRDEAGHRVRAWKFRITGFDQQLAALRHLGAGVQHQVHDGLFHFRGVHTDLARQRPGANGQFNERARD